MILGKPLVSLKLRSSEMKSDASFSSNCDFSELLLNFIREGKNNSSGLVSPGQLHVDTCSSTLVQVHDSSI